MKLRMLVGCLSLSVLGLGGCEESGEPAAEQPAGEAAAPAEAPKPAEEPAKPAEVPPSEVCTQLAAAAKAGEEPKILATLAPGGAEALAGEGVKDAVVATWSNATCGEAKVDGDKATVPVTVADAKEPKEATFVKAADGWKFDLAAWLAKYPLENGKGKKGKKAKKAKGKKAKS